MSTISRFDNTTGSGLINSRYNTSVKLFECMHMDQHQYNAIAAAIRLAEEEAIKYAKRRITDKVNDAINNA